jgi:ParB/RepB/Spo0J family partition protein
MMTDTKTAEAAETMDSGSPLQWVLVADGVWEASSLAYHADGELMRWRIHRIGHYENGKPLLTVGRSDRELLGNHDLPQPFTDIDDAQDWCQQRETRLGAEALAEDEADKAAESKAADVPMGTTMVVPLAAIEVAEGHNARQTFDAGSLFELGESMNEIGQLQPVILEQLDKAGERFGLIAGERRFRAARKVGKQHIRAEVYRGLSDRQRVIMADAENRQRVQLNPIEDARSFEKLRDVGLSIDEIAHHARVSDDTVRRRLNLLELPETVQDLVADGSVPFKHAVELGKPLGYGRRIELALWIAAEHPTDAEVRERVNGITGPKLEFEAGEADGERADQETDETDKGIEHKGKIVTWATPIEDVWSGKWVEGLIADAATAGGCDGDDPVTLRDAQSLRQQRGALWYRDTDGIGKATADTVDALLDELAMALPADVKTADAASADSAVHEDRPATDDAMAHTGLPASRKPAPPKDDKPPVSEAARIEGLRISAVGVLVVMSDGTTYIEEGNVTGMVGDHVAVALASGRKPYVEVPRQLGAEVVEAQKTRKPKRKKSAKKSAKKSKSK